jgi:metal-responsive CopG/Arc/MetJ family transcriptional regulator
MKKPGEPMKSFKIRLPEALLADLEEFASRDHRSIANFVRKILDNFIQSERAKPVEGMKTERNDTKQ